MKKTTFAAVKTAPRFVDDNHVLVTKEFAKNARIFGTPEYKLWREIKRDCEDAEMVTKTIKKNPNKKTSTKNMTYERMAIYIREQDEAATLMVEFKKQISLSKVQTNPYRCVLAWFKQTFQDYDDYKAFFEAEAQKEAKKGNTFEFYEVPQAVTQTQNAVPDNGQNFEECPSPDEQAISDGQSVLPEDTEININYKNNNGINNRNDPQEDYSIYIPKVKEVVISRPVAEGKDRPKPKEQKNNAAFEF